MNIKCWGSRGSVPVSGKPYLKYGGDTTCVEVIAKSGETIIIDAGTGMRNLGNSLVKRGITRFYLVFTHVHWDHILGFVFFKPLFSRKNKIFIQDRTFSGLSTKHILGKVMQKPFFPIDLNSLKADVKFDKTLNNEFYIGSLKIETVPTSHSNGALGYKFTEGQKSFVFFTDHEIGFKHSGSKKFDDYLNFSQDTDLLFHDAEYTNDEYKHTRGWGHSSIQDVLDFSVKANVKKLGLIHLNRDRTDDQMDQIINDCQADLKNKNSGLDCFAVSCNFEIIL